MTNPRRSFNRSWSVLGAAGALSLSLALAGCSSDANGESPTTAASQLTSGSASASNSAAASSSPVAKPQEATPTSPAKNIPEPVMPAAAKKNTAEGLEAFTRYWFEVANYSQKTSDTKQMMDLCVEDSEFCEARKKLADQLRERDAWIVGGEASVGKFYTQMKKSPAGFTIAVMELSEKERQLFNVEGPIATGSAPATKVGVQVFSIWDKGRWKFLAPAPIEGAEVKK